MLPIESQSFLQVYTTISKPFVAHERILLYVIVKREVFESADSLVGKLRLELLRCFVLNY